ncbi:MULTISPECIES: class I SAM-dependent methyltransferase [unclassified Rathayibacter]|uniref:class I SAM-dependent methyltransferase n=1 Tax=unclassified Rathayibacter TaxID=2609250 RepID=UPI0010435861|nr:MULTISPECIES: methyltransferase [unclassified Rathayibacter]MCJ1689159.1 class I SAM-dependent methyltransferase [Rathayibacter sp. VKM Ac-2927]MCJ1704723.1 class I SAM-dependent methyltransferase [Rathayibacter sp. VKM Ac-2926]TCL78783.1 16S rRNA m(2)G 1207 methyltransferase [Rathayibacter sp. PhB192]TCM25051.1 16S rRNA m(2)G 1207 methyltransferase [Rathayibacter sp. PhB179]
MAAEHYFTSTPDGDLRPRRISARIAGRDLEVTTAGGVFSPGHVDLGTRVLLDAVPDAPASGDLLDLGCGWGPISLALALGSPDARVWAVDVNQRALELVRRNCAELGVSNVNAVLPEDVPEDVRFAAVWSNPPIRVGKAELHALLERWLPRLEPDAEGWLVVQRNLGADSLLTWLTETFEGRLEVDRISSAKGFRVIRTTRTA